uniref:Uncharacterized protein n=1 Tax=Rhabditophanes sp. KR3021 TaxID=114890 RepID=A0AC35TQ84_9BILA
MQNLNEINNNINAAMEANIANDNFINNALLHANGSFNESGYESFLCETENPLLVDDISWNNFVAQLDLNDITEFLNSSFVSSQNSMYQLDDDFIVIHYNIDCDNLDNSYSVDNIINNCDLMDEDLNINYDDILHDLYISGQLPFKQ